MEERKIVQDYMDEWMAKNATTAEVEISREETNFEWVTKVNKYGKSKYYGKILSKYYIK